VIFDFEAFLEKPQSIMSRNNHPIYLPQLDEVLDRFPLTVHPQTSLIEVIALMGQLRSSCSLDTLELSIDPSGLTSPLLGEARASCVLVIEPTTGDTQRGFKLGGIFTERDLVQLIASGRLGYASGLSLSEIPIAQVMTQPVRTLTEVEAQDIFTVLLLLRQYRIRHLPIINDTGSLLGVVTPESIRQAMLQPANLLKMRRVAEVMNTTVVHAPLHSSVLQVAQLMATHRVSCVTIVEAIDPPDYSKPVGMVTERDIVQFQALELDLSSLPVEMVMSTPLFCLSPDNSLWVAHQEMQQRYVRRLVVAGDHGELLGIVTQTSLLQVLDPMEMSGIIDSLQVAVEQQTRELQKAIASLSLANTQLENEIAIRERAEDRLRLLESVVVNANDAIVIMEGRQDCSSDHSMEGVTGMLSEHLGPRIVYVNEAFTQMTGYSPEEIIGKCSKFLIGPKTEPVKLARMRHAFSRCEPLRMELIQYRKDGSEYWVELNSVPVINHQGVLTHWISVQRDVTERKRMEQALFEEKELAQVTLKSIGDGVITTDAQGRITSLNPVAEQLTGWSSEEAKVLPLTEVFKIVNEVTRQPVENIAEIALRENRVVDLINHSVLIARNNEEFAIDHSAAPIHASDGQIMGTVLVFRDSTSSRNMARQLSWQANHDALTGLVNRREFEYQLEQAVFNAQTQNQQHILLYLDLDRFKIVNDTCGHSAGDELLRQIAQQFQQKVRKTDILARLGGDEFAVLLYQCPLDQGIQIAELLLQTVQGFRFGWQEKNFTIGVSIGLVAIDQETRSAANVLSQADTGCYAAKDQGRNRVHICQVPETEEAASRGEIQWVVQINQAIEDNRLSLYCQPILSLSSRKSKYQYCEILLRLRNEKGQFISPMAFIPTAERYHLMQKIDRWVIQAVFEYLSGFYNQSSLTSEPTNSPLYAINLSGEILNQEGFIDFLKEQFYQSQVSPHLICFEITEMVILSHLTKAATLIKSLKEMGCWFALDDFGSGMSSFNCVRTLPIDFLKIDGSLIKNIVDNPIDNVLVESVNRIAHAMNIETIAKCVENEAIFQKVQDLKLDYAQGYAIAPPQPLGRKDSVNFQDVIKGGLETKKREKKVVS
jgi:diguanylate cyclase (GGDEF)-like protein/PAS domain S-box-containing protein